jgi:hypothetical protein
MLNDSTISKSLDHQILEDRNVIGQGIHTPDDYRRSVCSGRPERDQ